MKPVVKAYGILSSQGWHVKFLLFVVFQLFFSTAVVRVNRILDDDKFSPHVSLSLTRIFSFFVKQHEAQAQAQVVEQMAVSEFFWRT